MTRIGVVSDTHGSIAALRACVSKAGAADGWFHLGDYALDALRLAELTGKPVWSVLGNCDGWLSTEPEENRFLDKQKRAVSERVVTVENARIFLTHGHHYDVDLGPYALSYRAEELNCQAALYGHTHRGELSAFGGLLILNPGSPSRPRGLSKPSFAVMEIDGKDVNASIITIE